MSRQIIAGELESRSGDTNPLESVRRTINFSSLAWTAAKDTGWIYGIVSGFDCEESHEHDEICGGLDSMPEMATLHGWTPRQVARLRALRRRWREIEQEEATHPAKTARLEQLEVANQALQAENIALLTRLAVSESGQRWD